MADRCLQQVLGSQPGSESNHLPQPCSCSAHRMPLIHSLLDQQLVGSTAGHAVEVASHQHGDVCACSNLLQALQQCVDLHRQQCMNLSRRQCTQQSSLRALQQAQTRPRRQQQPADLQQGSHIQKAHVHATKTRSRVSLLRQLCPWPETCSRACCWQTPHCSQLQDVLAYVDTAQVDAPQSCSCGAHAC